MPLALLYPLPLGLALVLFFKNFGLGGPSPAARPPASIAPTPGDCSDRGRFFQLKGRVLSVRASRLHFPLSGMNFPLSGVNFTNFTSSWLLLGASGSFRESLRALESILSPQTRLSGAPALARAETGRPQNWSPAFFGVLHNDFFDFFNPGESV